MRKRVVRAIRSVLSATPIVRKRLSPLFLGRVASFQTHCEKMQNIPRRIGRKGFYLSMFQEERQRRKPPDCLDDDDLAAFWQQVPIYQGGIENSPPPTFLAGLSFASILAGGVAIRTHDNFLLHDPFHHPKHINQSGLHRRALPPIDLYLPGNHIHMGLLWGTAHYHWILDVLPRLAIVEQFAQLGEFPLILPEAMTAMQRESLHVLGIRADRLIDFHGNHWQVERLYYPSPLGVSGNPTSLSASWLRDRFASAAPTCSRRLYVSRNDVTVRRIVNEELLVKALASFGFEAVCCGGMSFADQVRLFSEAEIVVGPHGGGLTNIVFARPGATVIEVFPPSYINGCFWALSDVCGHKYGFLVGTQRGQDIEVEISKLLRLLTSLMSAPSISAAG